MVSPLNDPDPKVLARLDAIEPFAIAAAGLTTLGALAGLLPALAPHLPPLLGEMRPPTAIAVFFMTLALAFSARRMPPLAQVVGGGIALGIVLTPSLALLARAGLLGIPHERLANLPAVGNLVATLATALALLWNRETRGPRGLAADTGTAVGLVSVLFLAAGYFFNGIGFTGAAHVPLQSPPTLLSVGLLVLVLAMRRIAAGGAFGFLVANGIGSRIARAVLPAVTLMPFLVFEALSALEHAGLSFAFSRAFLTPVVAIVSVALVLWMARRANWIENHLRHQSATDQLTGLLNQRGFEDATSRLDRMPARREGGVIAFFFDLDNLKRANDLLGHTVGSEVIQRFADLLAVTFRKTDVIGRVGGDEFVVLAPAPAESASEMLNRFARVVETLNRSEHLPLPISYSVGFAQLPPGDSGNLNRLIAQADARMYAEKSRKRAA